jgi:TPP-dependent pyruvate/acetoin dehydrogenase alpha subunit
MLLWRKFEDKLAALYRAKSQRILHLYNGQTVLAGALHAMDLTKDKMITAYRNHVQPIGMGVDPKRNGRTFRLEHQKGWVDLCTFSQRNTVFMVDTEL